MFVILMTHFLLISPSAHLNLQEENWRFVACTFEAQECAYSCSQIESFKIEYDPDKCIGPAQWACYCKHDQ